MNEPVTIWLPDGRQVAVECKTTYIGTDTPTNSAGGGNTERYLCVYRDVEMTGLWNGDGRHNTRVEDCPAELVAELTAIRNERDSQRDV